MVSPVTQAYPTTRTRSGALLKPTEKAMPRIAKKNIAKASGRATKSKKPSSKPTSVPGPESTPAPMLTVKEDIQELVQIPSSPPAAIVPMSSPLPKEPQYEMEFEYSLRVNKVMKMKDSGHNDRLFFLASSVENQFIDMISKPASGVDGKEYSIINYTVSFRVVPKGTWKHLSLDNMSFVSGIRLLDTIDRQVYKFKRLDYVELKIEASIEVSALQKAFPSNRHVNEMSSPLPETSAIVAGGGSRTARLLREAKQQEQAEAIFSTADIESQIHNRWRCQEERCDNYPNWCWVPIGGQEHFEIRTCDVQTWAKRKLEGTDGVSIEYPPPQMMDYWRRYTGSKLRINRHTGKKASKRESSPSDSENDKRKKRRNILENKKIELEARKLEGALDKLEDAEEEREQRRAQRKREQEQLNWQRVNPASFATSNWSYPTTFTHGVTPLPAQLLSAPPVPPASQSFTAALPTCQNIPAPSSSPIAGSGREDTRQIIKAFFGWLILQQPEDERADYEHAADIAIDQRWTIEDLREMSKPDGNLYSIAVRDFKLKDGIVRHFVKDIRKYKPIYRGADILSSLTSNNIV